MNLIYHNHKYNISLYNKGLSAYYECDKCNEKLRTVGIEFVANNKEQSRYYIPEELYEEYDCESEGDI